MGFEEKRQYTRAACEIEAVGRSLTSNSQNLWETMVSDISEGGFRCKTNQFIALQDKFLIKLKIPVCKPIEVVTQPAWIREVPSLNLYDLGAEFVELAQEDKSILRQYIKTRPGLDGADRVFFDI